MRNEIWPFGAWNLCLEMVFLCLTLMKHRHIVGNYNLIQARQFPLPFYWFRGCLWSRVWTFSCLDLMLKYFTAFPPIMVHLFPLWGLCCNAQIPHYIVECISRFSDLGETVKRIPFPYVFFIQLFFFIRLFTLWGIFFYLAYLSFSYHIDTFLALSVFFTKTT